MIAGLVLILFARWHPGYAAAATVLWLGDCLSSLGRQWRGTRRVTGLRMRSDGSIALFVGGQSISATLASGTVVLERVAWLRIRGPDGSRYGELLLARHAEAEAWQRFQLLWQLRNKAFSGPPRA